MTELKETLSKLADRLKDEKEIDMIQNEIAYYKKRQQDLEGNLLWLSVKGAVLAPTIFFFISLLLCVFGILEVSHPEILLASSLIFVAIGILCLGKTLKATEKASLEVLKPDWDIFFTSTELKTMECKTNTRRIIRFTIHNVGDEAAENILMTGYFPKGIEVEEARGRWNKGHLFSKYKQEFMGCWSVEEPTLNVDGFFTTAGIKIVAKQAGIYKIRISIGDKSGKSTHDLTLKVE